MLWIDNMMFKFGEIFEDCFQCDPPTGWKTLVESLVEYINWHNSVHRSDVKVHLITEAHGGLKFVIHTQPTSPIIAEEIFGAIHLAETMSCKICQKCGAPAEFRKYRIEGNLKMSALCDMHFEELSHELDLEKTSD
tara:strand:+ start:1239 stop:1646 length:408 start_codon:yes stop_codon:yes gene_type:complete